MTSILCADVVSLGCKVRAWRGRAWQAGCHVVITPVRWSRWFAIYMYQLVYVLCDVSIHEH